MLEPLAVAVRGKSWRGMTRRAFKLGRRYGLSSAQMARRLAGISQVLEQFQCGATLPITAAALARHIRVLKGLSGGRIELAAHGYAHIDHARLSGEAQTKHFAARMRIAQHCNPGLCYRAARI